jgi:hypothetical protein
MTGKKLFTRKKNKKNKNKTMKQPQAMKQKNKNKKNKIFGGFGGNTKSNKTNKPNKTNKTIKQFKKLNCSPTNSEKSISNFTCYEKDDLLQLKTIWNARHPDKPIETNDPKEIWVELKNYYSNICNKESCWVRQMVKNPKLKRELLNSFAPKSPDEWKKNPNEWLSSLDILRVMNQYEKKYKYFDFIGPSPIDYDTHMLNGECVWEELCHFNLKNHMKKKYTKIGVIFNTDHHNKGGEHWISLFIDIANANIFFFDSVGHTIPKRIKNFVDDIILQGKELKNPINFEFEQNEIEHQKGNTECGMYSLYFIIHMLENKFIKTQKIKDEYIEKFRKIYFNGDV